MTEPRWMSAPAVDAQPASASAAPQAEQPRWQQAPQVEAPAPTQAQPLKEAVRRWRWRDLMPENLRIDPDTARFAGGLAGGMVGGAAGIATPIPGDEAPLALAGGALGAELFGQGAELVNRWLLDEEDPYLAGSPDPTQRAADAATMVMGDMAISGTMARAGEVARKAGGAVQRLVRPADNTGARALAAAERQGVDAAGMGAAASGQPLVRMAQEGAKNLPTSAGIMRRAIDRTTRSIAGRIDDLARGQGAPSTVEDAGRMIRGAAGETKSTGLQGFRDHLQMRSRRFMAQLNGYFDPGEKIGAGKTLEYLSAPAEALEGLPNTQEAAVPSEFRGMLKDLQANGGQLTWQQLKAIRTRAGEKAQEIVLAPGDATRTQWRRLYKAMSEDLGAAAAAKGERPAKLFAQHNAAYSEGMGRMDDFLENIVKNPETAEAFKKTFAGAKDGAERIRAVKKSLTRNEWRAVTGFYLRNMGMESKGAGAEAVREFSPRTFLTNWRGLSDEAKQTMFGGKSDLRKNLDDLVKVVSEVEKTGAFKNTSGTAGMNAVMYLLTGAGGASGYAQGGMSGAIAGVAAPLAIPPSAAWLLTNERVVRWMSQAVKIPPADYAGTAAHIGRLANITQNEPVEVRNAAREFLNYWKAHLPMRAENDEQQPQEPARVATEL